jgi:ATP-dependent DNA ligase
MEKSWLWTTGRVSFNLLQHHRSKAQALLFYVFDVLAHHGRSLMQEPLKQAGNAQGHL